MTDSIDPKDLELFYLRRRLDRLEARVTALAEPLSNTLEVNRLWDGS